MEQSGWLGVQLLNAWPRVTSVGGRCTKPCRIRGRAHLATAFPDDDRQRAATARDGVDQGLQPVVVTFSQPRGAKVGPQLQTLLSHRGDGVFHEPVLVDDVDSRENVDADAKQDQNAGHDATDTQDLFSGGCHRAVSYRVAGRAESFRPAIAELRIGKANCHFCKTRPDPEPCRKYLRFLKLCQVC